MRVVLSYLNPYKYKLIVNLMVKSGATLMELFLPWLLAYVIDTIIPTQDVGAIIIFGVLMLISSGLAFVGNVVANRMAARISSDAIKTLRDDGYTKIMNFSNRTVDEFKIPSLVSRMTTDTYHIYRMFNVVQRIGVRAPILLMGSIVLMIMIDLNLALVLIALMPLIIAVIFFISKRGVPYYSQLQKELDSLIRIVRENIAGIRVIKALAKEKDEQIKFEQVNLAVSKKERSAGYVVSMLNPMMNLLLNMGLITILYFGAIRVSQGLSQIGSIIAFLTYFTLILMSFLALNRIFLMYSRANASAIRIVEILDREDAFEVIDAESIVTDMHIEFRNVDFSYNKTKNNLEDISFQIKRSQTFGIIGSTGSGKSTIAQLLLRFYDVDAGQIMINGKDIKSYDIKQLRTMFGVVLQNDVLFSSTVSDNIRFGRNVEDESLMDAADMAQATEFIDKLKDKYQQEVLRGGANFSGGQRQRMLIARALADHPEIVIFDDASSALDYKTDATLRNRLRKSGVSTVILIAQRVSTVLNADNILVLEEGRIVGLGTHEELIRECDVYRELVELQLGGREYVNA
jgi:ATP-binding cassette subfamily B multidrug efflux pump